MSSVMIFYYDRQRENVRTLGAVPIVKTVSYRTLQTLAEELGDWHFSASDCNRSSDMTIY